MLALRHLLLALLTAVALVLAACGDDDDEGGDSAGTGTQAAETAPAETPTETAPAEEEPASQEVSKDRSKKPTVPRQSGEPPSKLVKKDIVEGKGATAKEGDMVSVQYVGTNFSNGAEFDASWDRGQPFEFQLGGGQVIPGWEQGVAGMKEGGRRMLVIPPDLGYGPQGTPDGSIPPNETLVFVIDLEKVSRGQ